MQFWIFFFSVDDKLLSKNSKFMFANGKGYSKTTKFQITCHLINCKQPLQMFSAQNGSNKVWQIMRNVSLVNNKSVKEVKNLHFQKHATLVIPIYKSRTFLVLVISDSLCKFVIFSGNKLSDKIENFWSQYLLFLKECQT